MGVFQNEPCQIEISERDLYNPRTLELLEPEKRTEVLQNETRQIGVVSREVLLAEDGSFFLTRHVKWPSSMCTLFRHDGHRACRG